MKLAIVNFYQGHNLRGGETFVEALKNNLSSKVNTKIYSAKSENFPLPPVWSILHHHHPLRYLFLDLPALYEFVFTLKIIPNVLRQKPDIIMPCNSGWQVLILSILTKITGAKLAISGQSGNGWYDRWNLFVKPDLFIALTKHNQSWAEKAALWQTRIIYIPNGVDLKLFKSIGPKVKLDLKGKIIAVVAANSPSKRIDLTIKAVSMLKNASLLLIGDGELKEKIDQLANKTLGKDRFLHLILPHSEIPKYLRSADIFTMVSEISESFGIVYLESMACGLGVVTRNDPSRREIVGDAGLYVNDPENSGEYASILQKSLQQDWAAKSVARAKNYSWANIAADYEKNLNLLLDIK